MYRIKKLVLSIALLMLWPFMAGAQQSVIGVYGAGAVPVGEFGYFSNIGVGGGISYDYLIGARFSLGAEIHLLRFGEQQFVDIPILVMPVLVNVGYHTDLTPKLGLIGKIGGGYFIYPDFDELENEGFGVSAQIGIDRILTANRTFTLMAGYSYAPAGLISTSYVSLMAGVQFLISP
ncbi:MAG: outer membrane beta-barrel protein [Owenweeksia sp.]